MAKDKAKAKAKETEEAEIDKEEVEEADAPEGEKGEGEGEGDGEGAPPAKKSKKKLIIIIAAVLVLLIAVGAGLFFSGILGGESHENKATGEELGPDGKPITQAVFYTLPEFLINLNTGGKQTSFLKATVILEVKNALDVPLIEANLPRLMDGYNTYLRELRASDLSGSAGIQRLREELLLRANKALAPVKINDVLFKQIVVQ
jgi:flagellar FliL protein